MPCDAQHPMHSTTWYLLQEQNASLHRYSPPECFETTQAVAVDSARSERGVTRQAPTIGMLQDAPTRHTNFLFH